MKKLSKILTLALATVMSVSVFAACGGGTGGGGKTPNTETDVQIYMWKSGYGTEFMQQIVDKFNAKQSKYKATLDTDSVAATIIKSLENGKSNTYDLYFTMLNTTQYNKQFIKLDDVLDYKNDGESKSIREKYYSYLLDGVKNADGTTNFLTYGNGWTGIVYNANIIDGVKYKVPNTTDELNKLVARLANDDSLTSGKNKVYPWLFYNDSNNNGYWNYETMVWEAQYDGLDYYYNNMLALKDENGISPSKEVFTKKDGRYQALKVLENIVTPTTVHPMCTSTNFTNVQKLFLDGEAVFGVNGGWLMNESSGKVKNIVMMKTPVISSIVEKLEDTAMTDATLSAIITEIDEGKTSSELCSANDFARIKQARNLLYNNASEQYVFIPEYSNAIDGAKEFLKYLYSDEGIATYMKVTSLPGSARLDNESLYSTASLDDWHKRQHELAGEVTALTEKLTKSFIFTNNSMNQFASVPYAQALCAQNQKDKKTADELWAQITSKINKNWSDWAK